MTRLRALSCLSIAGEREVNTFPDTVLSDTRQKLFRVMAQPFHWTKVT